MEVAIPGFSLQTSLAEDHLNKERRKDSGKDAPVACRVIELVHGRFAKPNDGDKSEGVGQTKGPGQKSRKQKED
jgi:hypothetical protein